MNCSTKQNEKTNYHNFTILPANNFNGSEKEIRFEYETLDIPNSNIYIESVIDGRMNQNYIGTVVNGSKTDSIDLKDGACSAFYNYLKFILPKDSSKTPFVLKISELSITEYKTSAFDSIKVKLVLGFYKKDKGNLKEIYETESLYSTENNDGSKGFEICLKRSLAACLTDFINLNNAYSQYQNKQTVINQPIQNKDTITKKETPTDVKNERIKRTCLLTYCFKQGINATGYAISFYSYSNRERNGWIIPWILGVDIMKIKANYFSQFDFQSAKLNYCLPGIIAFKKLNDYLWLNIGLQIPIGSETLIDFSGNKTINFLIGLAPTQGFYFIPKSAGFIFGVGLYEKLLSSEVYQSDIGFKVEIGIRF